MIGGLQMLRGVAATLVVLFHLRAASVFAGQDPGPLRWFRVGEAGVDVFLVLSGFVIFHAAQGRTGRGPGWFLRQRFWRIVPSYWAALFLTLVAMAGFAVTRGDWSDWPSAGRLEVSVAMLPLPGQVMAVAWTLTVEWLFYLVFAATFFRFGAAGAVAALALWALATQGIKVWPAPLQDWMGLILYSGLIEFLFGGLIALAYAAGWRRSRGRWGSRRLSRASCRSAGDAKGWRACPRQRWSTGWWQAGGGCRAGRRSGARRPTLSIFCISSSFRSWAPFCAWQGSRPLGRSA